MIDYFEEIVCLKRRLSVMYAENSRIKDRVRGLEKRLEGHDMLAMHKANDRHDAEKTAALEKRIVNLEMRMNGYDLMHKALADHRNDWRGRAARAEARARELESDLSDAMDALQARTEMVWTLGSYCTDCSSSYLSEDQEPCASCKITRPSNFQPRENP